MTKVKFCGICTARDIALVNETRPDFVGFVFVESRWQLTMEEAMRLRGGLADGIIPVGVFRDAPEEMVHALCRNGTIEMATFFGGDSYRTECPSITLWPDESGDYALFDKAKDGVGGTGERLDWHSLPKTGKPFFLAGGLTADNVAEAIALTQPYAVDVLSGIETNGEKDIAKMREFMKRVRENG